MKSEVVIISPEKATELLKTNKSNRKLSERIVQQYANEMKKGKWKFTADPIRFSKGNVLLDGQHRLSAIKLSGITVSCLVVTGLDSDVFDAIDIGKVRTSGDALSIANIKNPVVTGGIARFIMAYNSGLFGTRELSVKTRSSNADVLSFVQENPVTLSDAAEYTVEKCKKFKLISNSVFGGLFFIFNAIHEKSSFEFFEQFSSGIGLSANDPILLLRERLIKDQINKSKLPLKEKVALVVKTWNLFRKGKTVSRIRPTTDFLRAI